MFDPPPLISADVFATLPDDCRVPGPGNEWAEGQSSVVAATATVLEGPSFDRDGRLYCVDIPAGRIYRLGPERRFERVVDYDGWPNGLKIHRDGRIFVADFKHGIMLLDPASRSIEPYLVRANLERFKAVNDLFFARNGDLYFTDQGMTGLQDPSGRVFRVTPDGRVDCLLDRIPSPNGLVMNLDEDTLYVAVTRANAIWRVPLRRDGQAGKVGVFINLSGGGGPDGLALDAAGNLAIAHVGLGSVWLFSPIGEPLYRIKSPSGLTTTNLAYGGAGNKTLFITEAGTGNILTAELPTAGKPMFSHA